MVKSRYLLCVVGIVVGYELATAVTDFVINVIFERSFDSQVEIAQMYGRLGWIVSGTALVSQLVVVPRLLQQVTKESLYVPLTDVQRYKARAFIDVFVNRSAKALSSIPLLGIIAVWGASIRGCLAVAFASLMLWIVAANVLGRAYPAILPGEKQR